MKRCLPFASFALICCAALTSAGERGPELEALRKKPIANGGGPAGDLLRQWWKEGTAAGNAGDYYDNRDGDHSPLSLAPYPQMTAIQYSKEDIALRKHWAAQHTILSKVTFGNSSTSAPAHLGGSNPRSYYVHPARLNFLYNQYTRNNLYIYPEHRDHDPGHNGNGPGGEGYGDLYPTNTPYLIISQGSSGTDQPFMRMLPHVLAAFRPEVKKKLTETGLLMPTIQMLMRSTYKELKGPKDYLTAAAHTSVFEGKQLDALAVVKQAHALELNTLPPMVQLRVVEDDKSANGVDFFDLHSSEVLGYTPCCIARIHRGKARTQRLVVNADASFDVNKRPLTYSWVVLRGDPAKIKIVPKKDNPAVAEITVAHHERRPIAPGSAMESNRVDIGVFVHNGVHYSAPAFVTFFTLDREARTYDDKGNILELAHGLGETTLRATDWGKLLAFIASDRLAGQLLDVDDNQRGVIKQLAEEHGNKTAAVKAAQAEVKNAEAAQKLAKGAGEQAKAKKQLDAARTLVTAAQKETTDLLERKIDPLGESPRGLVDGRLRKLTRDPLFLSKHQAWLKERRNSANEARVKGHWQRLIRFGIATPAEVLSPLRPGKSLADAKWTQFEFSQLEAAHAGLLVDLVFPGMLQASYQVNFVDQRLSAPRDWRDIYRYDANGDCLGWTRHGSDGTQMFNHEGLLVVESDALGRCVKGQVVRYAQAPFKGKGFNTNPLRAQATDVMVRYEFTDSKDLLGRRATKK